LALNIGTDICHTTRFEKYFIHHPAAKNSGLFRLFDKFLLPAEQRLFWKRFPLREGVKRHVQKNVEQGRVEKLEGKMGEAIGEKRDRIIGAAAWNEEKRKACVNFVGGREVFESQFSAASKQTTDTDLKSQMGSQRSDNKSLRADPSPFPPRCGNLSQLFDSRTLRHRPRHNTTTTLLGKPTVFGKRNLHATPPGTNSNPPLHHPRNNGQIQTKQRARLVA